MSRTPNFKKSVLSIIPLAMQRDKDDDKKEGKRGGLREELEKESLEDLKPSKGGPDSLKEGDPTLDDVQQRFDREEDKGEDEKEPHGFK